MNQVINRWEKNKNDVLKTGLKVALKHHTNPIIPDFNPLNFLEQQLAVNLLHVYCEVGEFVEAVTSKEIAAEAMDIVSMVNTTRFRLLYYIQYMRVCNGNENNEDVLVDMYYENVMCEETSTEGRMSESVNELSSIVYRLLGEVNASFKEGKSYYKEGYSNIVTEESLVQMLSILGRISNTVGTWVADIFAKNGDKPFEDYCVKIDKILSTLESSNITGKENMDTVAVMKKEDTLVSGNMINFCEKILSRESEVRSIK